MKDRFIVELYDEDEVLQSSTIYKTYRDIAKGTGEAYYECRNIHLIGNGTITRKFMHPALKKLQKRMKILDIC